MNTFFIVMMAAIVAFLLVAIFYALDLPWHISKLLGKNTAFTPVETIKDQLKELRPLPIGRTEFEDWSNRIISGAMVKADPDSQKFVLANMVCMLGPTEDFKEDVYFIKALRKSAIDQTAETLRSEIRDRRKARKDEPAPPPAKKDPGVPSV